MLVRKEIVMKEKIIKKVLNKKKPLATIFALVPPLAMLLLIIYSSILILNNSSINANNIATFKQIMWIFSAISICWLIIAIYLIKFTNKLNVIKISKEDLEKLYDECDSKTDFEDIKGDFIKSKEDYITKIFI